MKERKARNLKNSYSGNDSKLEKVSLVAKINQRKHLLLGIDDG